MLSTASFFGEKIVCLPGAKDSGASDRGFVQPTGHGELKLTFAEHTQTSTSSRIYTTSSANSSVLCR